ncbi:MAG: DNA translocase FtsK [bacterium]|nr:DNA translocase FtsK [bacterium]
MAKKKKRKESKKSFEHAAELYGILLVLIAILGLGKYGVVGRFITSFSIFLFGSIYMLFLVSVLIIGAYLVVKREWPDFFTTKLIGIYVFTLGLLILMHQGFIEKESNMMSIFKETINELVGGFNSIMNTGTLTDLTAVGGGIIGGVFAILFDALFSYTGMQIVSWTLIGLGFLLFVGFSLFDTLKEKYKNRTPREKKEKVKDKSKGVIIKDGTEEITTELKDEGKHIKISSIDEITKVEQTKSSEESITDSKTEAKSSTNKAYKLPTIDLLDKPKKKNKATDNSVIEKNIETLENVLKDFKISGKVVEVHIGPTVVQYELKIASGTRVNKITSINREISLALAKKDVRIEAPIPGKDTVGIEFANDTPSPVSFYEIMDSPKMKSSGDKKLMVPLGKSIMGDIGVCEINKMPHLLIAGTTGSGKSVCVNGIICSILMRAKPEEVKLVMVDPKVVELSVYNGVPHLLRPVVTDPKQASIALAKMVAEMERRYQVFSESKTKNIEGYNAYIEKENAKITDVEAKREKMPYIVIIIDELADLMMVAAKEVEDSILRITQKARAAGMHLIVATQRPSTEVITGLIKANIPSRIAFSVGSGIDSRTILDQTGAENLLGKGDMLFLPIGMNSPLRIQGSFITDDEIKRIIDYTISQQKAQYDESMMNLDVSSSDKSASQIEDMNQQEEYDDPLYNDIVEFVISTQKASASLLQRKFKLGYNRAARIIDLLEERGIIGPSNGSKPREVLVQLNNNEE